MVEVLSRSWAISPKAMDIYKQTPFAQVCAYLKVDA